MFGVYKIWLRGWGYFHFGLHLGQLLLMNIVALNRCDITLCFYLSLTILLDEQRFHIIKLFNL